jgi:hypothetical protein
MITKICQFCGREFQSYPSRTGRVYCQRGCPGPVVGEWTEALAYLVGLIASDGNLQKGRVKRISIANKERDILDFCQSYLPRSSRYDHSDGGWVVACVWPNLYDWLVGIGIRPAKSLTMGALAVPIDWFWPFYRGVHDGDGNTSYDRGKYLHLSLACYAPEFRSWLVKEFMSRGVQASQSTDGLHFYGMGARYIASQAWWDAHYYCKRKRPR